MQGGNSSKETTNSMPSLFEILSPSPRHFVKERSKHFAVEESQSDFDSKSLSDIAKHIGYSGVEPFSLMKPISSNFTHFAKRVNQISTKF